jgi:glucose-6-phosphate isomerase
MLETAFGPEQATVSRAVQRIQDERLLDRIRARDYRVWGSSPDEIANRLGWLDSPRAMMSSMVSIRAVRDRIRRDGFRHAVLLGMGGSSLFPEALAAMFPESTGLELVVIDTTDPDALHARTDRLDLARTLGIVATKSGSTVETLSAFRWLYNRFEAIGIAEPGAHFIGITDPGSPLERLAEGVGFRQLFLNDPEIGGRYSALSHFGMVPAELLDLDVSTLLLKGHAALEHPGDAITLGAAMASLSAGGRDKLTLTASPGVAPFLDWIEQLIAESTGKHGMGLVPVVAEPLGDPAVYGVDRLFVDLQLGDDDSRQSVHAALVAAGHPVIRIVLADRYDIGGQTMMWALATAIAGALMGINPFDQPDVEAAKVLAREMVEHYLADGALPTSDALTLDSLTLHRFLADVRPGDYIALQVYANPTAALDRALAELRGVLRDQYQVATTVGYGPRFLHSTGQLHKGDGGRGHFVQIVSRAVADIGIPDRAGAPDSTMSFDTLKHAQALGDARALRAVGRRVLVAATPGDPTALIRSLRD